MRIFHVHDGVNNDYKIMLFGGATNSGLRSLVDNYQNDMFMELSRVCYSQWKITRMVYDSYTTLRHCLQSVENYQNGI